MLAAMLQAACSICSSRRPGCACPVLTTQTHLQHTSSSRELKVSWPKTCPSAGANPPSRAVPPVRPGSAHRQLFTTAPHDSAARISVTRPVHCRTATQQLVDIAANHARHSDSTLSPAAAALLRQLRAAQPPARVAMPCDAAAGSRRPAGFTQLSQIDTASSAPLSREPAL